MTAMPAKAIQKLTGSPTPRIAPPVPARHDLEAFRQSAEGMGIQLMPWQECAVRYLTAKGPDGLLFRTVCIVVARQNGKTTLMKPLIVKALREGKRIVHIAQTRELPRHMFGVIADAMSNEPDLFPKRRGKTIWPRYGAGQEEITLVNGGTYRIAAAGRGSARGQTNDIVIIDELREMDTNEVLEAAEPTLTMSPDPQMIFLSNAGDDSSVILNSVRARRDEDPALAYLEWSAAAERSIDDHDGWAEANPALGHYPSVMRTLEQSHTTHKLSGTLAIFETEHLCRWVPTMRRRLVEPEAWAACQGTLTPPVRPVMGVSMDPERARASAVMAWQGQDGKTYVKQVAEVFGSPIDTDRFGVDLRQYAADNGIRRVAYDPLTDADLAKYFRKAEPVTGRLFANASSTFHEQVTSRRLVWDEAPSVTEDIPWTSQKDHEESGSFQAVRAKDDRAITASLAAIRAVGLVFGPRPVPARIY